MTKLAEMFAAAHESNFTEEQFNNLRAEKNAKKVFDILRNGWSFQEKEYEVDPVAAGIMNHLFHKRDPQFDIFGIEFTTR